MLLRKSFSHLISTRLFSKEPYNIEKIFLNPTIFNLLTNIIDHDPNKVHCGNMLPKKNPQIDLLTKKQYEKMLKRSEVYTKQKLQIPPIKNPRVESYDVINETPMLKHWQPKDEKLVLIDINMLENDKERLMGIRESNGELRTATPSERVRYNQLYFPLKGREIVPPIMFNEDNLQRILDEGRYTFVLDKNCIQFEPDDPAYIAVCEAVYSHILRHCPSPNGVEQLSFTRHFPGLCLHFLLKEADSNGPGIILLELISQSRLEAVQDLVCLYAELHPDSGFSKAINNGKLEPGNEQTNNTNVSTVGGSAIYRMDLETLVAVFLQHVPLADSLKTDISQQLQSRLMSLSTSAQHRS